MGFKVLAATKKCALTFVFAISGITLQSALDMRTLLLVLFVEKDYC
jgi:hypothetical protein